MMPILWQQRSVCGEPVLVSRAGSLLSGDGLLPSNQLGSPEANRDNPIGKPTAPHCIMSVCGTCGFAVSWCKMKWKTERGVSKSEGLQEKEIEMIKGLEGLTYEERLKELITDSSDKGWGKRWFNNSLQILTKVSTVKKGVELFRVLHQGTIGVMEWKGKVTWDIGMMWVKPEVSLGSSKWVRNTNLLETLQPSIPKYQRMHLQRF